MCVTAVESQFTERTEDQDSHTMEDDAKGLG